MEASWAAAVPDVVLLSSVLQYFPDPVKLLQEIVTRGPRFILIDRTPLLEAEPECITVQTVPPSIYRASYACRLMAVPTIMAALSAQYRLRFAFDACVGGPIPVGGRQAHHRGYFFERR
jgi:putative methyltransferase (TIGR04325 family)